MCAQPVCQEVGIVFKDPSVHALLHNGDEKGMEDVEIDGASLRRTESQL